MVNNMDVLIVFLSLVAVPCTVFGQNSTETPTMTTEGPCPPEWLSYSTSCYLLTTMPPTNYTTAQTTCEGDCGYLVSLNDNDEYDFVINSYSSMSATFWIGLWRTCASCPEDTTTNWTWQDGTELNISKWYTFDDEPTGNSQCGLYGTGGLADFRCAAPQSFVCERPIFCPTTTTIIETTVTSTVLPTADSGGTSTVTSSDTATGSEGFYRNRSTDMLTGDISTTVANGDDEGKPIPVWVWVIVAISVVGLAVIGVVLYKCIEKKPKPRIPETPSKSEEPKNVDPSPPPCGVKYRPNYESVVLENEDKGKTNNGFEKGPPDGTQAHGGSGEQGKPVERPTDVYAEVRKKDSANGAEMVIVENTLYGAGVFKDL